VNASDLFAAEEIERARRYHRPLYLALVLDWALQVGVLAVIAFGVPGDWLRDATGGPWWARVLELVALVFGVSTLVRLPLSAWRGWAYERRWGFSTQSLRGWLVDVVKGLVLGAVLTGVALVALVWTVRAWPTWWPAVAAPGAAALTLVLSLLAPPLFERLFNRFWPLQDEVLARELRDLSERARVPVRTMLVTDASRRTTKHNAYVSGLGPTRRLVLFDTLLQDVPRGELRGVVAHELGHRRFRHVAIGTALAMAGAAALAGGEMAERSTTAAPPVSFWSAREVAASFAKGAVLFDGAGGRNYMVHTSRREQAGQVEVHARDTDVIHVIDGSATFVTGGTVVDGKQTAPDELRGARIAGGETRRLAKGDVVIVPAGTPHWFQTVDGPLTYYVVKVR